MPEKNTYRTVNFLCRLEDTLLTVLLMLMLGTAFMQIVLRNLMGSGIIWGDVFVRVLVLWIGMLGAMAASRSQRHIRIDLLSRYMPENLKQISTRFTEFMTALICGLAAFHSFRFVRSEFEYGDMAFAKIPVWFCEAIIPLAFIVISVRYLLHALTDTRPES